MDAVEVRESEKIKIGVDTGAGKTAWPQTATYGKRRPGDVDLTFRTATGEHAKSGRRLGVEGCATMGESIPEFEVSKRLCANHCCLLESAQRWAELQSCMVTMVTCPTRARMSRRRLKHGSRRRSALHNTTVAHMRTSKTTCTPST